MGDLTQRRHAYFGWPCHLLLRQSGSSGSSSDSDSPETGTGEVALKLNYLHSLYGQDGKSDTSTYAMNGCDKARLKDLLKNPCCGCKCTLPFKVLLQICSSFWGLPKETQDSLLWALQSEAGRRGKTKFSIEGPAPTKRV